MEEKVYLFIIHTFIWEYRFFFTPCILSAFTHIFKAQLQYLLTSHSIFIESSGIYPLPFRISINVLVNVALSLSLCIGRLGSVHSLYRCTMQCCEWNTIDNSLVTSGQSQLEVSSQCAPRFRANTSQRCSNAYEFDYL